MVQTQEELRGRFAMYIPPLTEELGLAEVEHNPRHNRMNASKITSERSVTPAGSKGRREFWFFEKIR